jgi:hypothetical protein
LVVKEKIMPKIARPVRPLADVNVLPQPDGANKIVACFMPDPELIFGEGDTRAFLAIDASLSMKSIFGYGGPFGGDPNYVQPVTRKLGQILSTISQNEKVSSIYWAVSNAGDCIEEIGEFDEEGWGSASIGGPQREKWGRGTKMLPAVKYGFEKVFPGSKGTLGVILTDGIIEDEQECIDFCTEIGRQFEGQEPAPFKLVLIGIGQEVDKDQLARFDDMFEDTGIDYDLWSSGDVASMREEADILGVLFGELMDDEAIIAPTGSVKDGSGNQIASWTDGMPGKFSFVLPKGQNKFIIHCAGQAIEQDISEAL